MGMITLPWDSGTTEVDEKWFNRAKELVMQHAITSSEPMVILGREMGSGLDMTMASKLVVLANAATYEQRYGVPLPDPRSATYRIGLKRR